jgi:FkbM family methyltransferase
MSIRSTVDDVLSRRGLRILNEANLGLAAGDVYLTRLFKEFDFDFVFDVGANTGQYALHLTKSLGYAGRILSIEPIPELIRALKSALSHEPQWSHMACALDRTEGTAEFNVMVGSQFSSLLKPAVEFAHSFEGKLRVAATIDVPVRTLDAVFREAQLKHGFSRSFLKLDTQGTELPVLEGGPQALSQICAIQTEVSFTAIYEGAPDFHRIFEFMKEAGYDLSGLFPNNQGHFPRLLEMDAVFVRRDLMPKTSDIR